MIWNAGAMADLFVPGRFRHRWALWRWSRRNPPLALVAAACVCLGAAVIWLGITRWEIEREATQTAKKLLGPLIPEKSLAVLPFENLSHEKANDVFVDGIHEKILKDLARISGLKVINRQRAILQSRFSARSCLPSALTLGVKYLVEGDVQRDARRIRVNAQLG